MSHLSRQIPLSTLAVALLILTVLACRPPTIVAPTPTATEIPTLAPSATPTQPPAPTASRPITLTYIRMLGDMTGWAIGRTVDSDNHILRTHDGGNAWHDVTPAGLARREEEDGKIAFGFFLDADLAWVTYPSFLATTPEPLVVWHTSDGGRSWEPSRPLDIDNLIRYVPDELRASIGVQDLYFVDAQYGWLLLDLGFVGMHHCLAALFRSTDGGKSWERVIDPDSDSGLDLQLCSKTGMVFADGRTGLVTFSEGPWVRPFVDWTLDGGLTWITSELPPPETDPGLFDRAICGSQSATLILPRSVVLALKCGESGGYYDYYVYATDDDGLTWHTKLFPGGWMQFINAEIGWSLGPDIYLTRDGGETWILVSTVDWDGQFSFVSEQLGWAVARSGDTLALVQTTDGGRTWKLLEPQIVS